jgi:hypothetical protein
MKRVLLGLASLGLFLGNTVQVKADYLFTTLDVPGSTSTRAQGINASGQIVGTYGVGFPAAHGFLLNGGSYTTFDVPGSITTEADGINASGQIVGVYHLPGGGPLGYLLSGGSYTTLAPFGSTFTSAIGINAFGQIVGGYNDGSINHG